MIIKQLKLHNIRSYTDATINFPTGSLLLSGDIGSGKSSILLAIEFALFGFIRGSVSGDTLLRNGKHEGSIELHFQINKRNVVIKRNLKRTNTVKQDSGYIIIDDVKSDCTAIELKAKVLSLLGYSADMVTKSKDLLYRYTVYTPQEQMKQILLDAKENRLETLRRVFMIDKYKKIRENSVIILKKLKAKRTFSQGQITDLDDKQEEQKKLTLHIKELEAALQEQIPHFSLVKDQIAQKRSELEKIKEQQIKYNELKNKLSINEVKQKNLSQLKEKNMRDLDNVNKQLTVLTEKIKLISINDLSSVNLAELEMNLTQKEQALTKYKERMYKHEQDLTFTKSRLEQYEHEIEQKAIPLSTLELKKKTYQDLKEQSQQLTQLKQDLEQAQKDLISINGYLKEHEITIDNANKVKDKLSDLSKCPTCLQDVDADHKKEICDGKDMQINQAKESLQRLQNQRREYEQRNTDLKQKIVQAEQHHAQYTKLEVELKNLEELQSEISKKKLIVEKLTESRTQLEREAKDYSQEKLTQLEEEVKTLKEKYQTAQKVEQKKKEHTMLQEQIALLEKTKQSVSQNNQEISNQILQIKEELATVSTQLQSLSQIESQFKELEQSLEGLLTREKQLEIDRTKIESQRTGYQEQLKKVAEEIDGKLLVKKKIDVINQYSNWISKYFINLTTTMEKHVMMQLYHEFNQLFIDWFKVLIDDEYVTVRLDDEFTPIIEQNGYEIDITNLSGGERTAVCLAYRLALNKVINDFVTSVNTKDLIVLDEPTEGFSHEQLDRLKDVLDELDIRQVIIVSHEAKVESFVDSVIKVEKTDHISRVVNTI